MVIKTMSTGGNNFIKKRKEYAPDDLNKRCGPKENRNRKKLPILAIRSFRYA